MSTSFEIYSKITEYMSRRITLRQLEYWLVHMIPIYLLNPNSEVASLCNIIELGLAEINAGIQSERGFRKLLSQHISSDSMQSEYYPFNYGITITSTSGSITEPIDWGLRDQSPSWSSEPLAEFA